MINLISLIDIRQFRQVGKQVNTDLLNAYVREIQDNHLSELLGQALVYDLYNFLENGFTNNAGAFTRDSTTQITISDVDVSEWSGYSLKLNSDTFVLIDSAVFGGIDTVLTVLGYDLPSTITTIAYSTENKYTKLLNGVVYTYNSKSIEYKGLRAFLCWNWINAYLIDGNLKQNDAGNFKIIGDNFASVSTAQINQARSTYSQNATREENKITMYLNENSTLYPLWESKSTQNIMNNAWFVV